MFLAFILYNTNAKVRNFGEICKGLKQKYVKSRILAIKKMDIPLHETQLIQIGFAALSRAFLQERVIVIKFDLGV